MTDFNPKRARAKRPCPLWVDAFQRDTQHLSADEVGSYILILMAMWTREACDFPDDDRRLAAVSRVSLRLWKSRIGPIIRAFLTAENGALISDRLRKEAAYVERQVSLQSERKSGEKSRKPLESKEPHQTADVSAGQPRDYPSQLPNNPTVEEEAKASSCLSPTKDHGFAEFWEQWPHKDGKQAALKAWRKLSMDEKRLAYRAVTGGWFDRWRTRYKDANPILPASFLNQKRWEDAQQPDLIPINGGQNAQRTDKQSERLNAFIAGARGT